MPFKLEFDREPAKRATNLAKHGLDFDDAGELFARGELRVHQRFVRGEERQEGFGFFFRRLTCVVYVWRGPRVRLISWRKANAREKDAYSAQTSDWERFKAP